MMHRILKICLLTLMLCLLVSCSEDNESPTSPDTSDRQARIVEAPREPTSVSDILVFSALVTDNMGSVTQAQVVLRSNQDGVLGSGHPNSDGMIYFTVPALSRGVHTISLWVDFGSSSDLYDVCSVQHILPARVQMGEAVISIDGVSLSWTESAEETFVRYELRRWIDDEDYDNSEMIASYTNRTVTTGLDPESPLAEMVHYAVNVVISGDLDAESGPVDVARPNGPVLDFEPFDSILHPTETIIYILDRSFITSRLVAINYDSKEVMADRTFDCFLQYMDVADNGFGVEVYVSRYDDGISVLDDTTLEEIVHVPMGYPTCSVATDGKGHVFVSLGGLAWGVSPVRIYDRSTWTLISEGVNGEWSRFEHIPGTNEIIGLGYQIYHYHYDAAGQFIEHSFVSPPYGAYASARTMRIDPTGNYFATHTFGCMYSADSSLEHLGNLPDLGGIYKDFTFNSDGSTIIAGYSVEKAALLFDASTLAETGSIPMRGYACYLFNDGEYLVGVSRPEMNDERVCVDVRRLPEYLW